MCLKVKDTLDKYLCLLIFPDKLELADISPILTTYDSAVNYKNNSWIIFIGGALIEELARFMNTICFILFTILTP